MSHWDYLSVKTPALIKCFRVYMSMYCVCVCVYTHIHVCDSCPLDFERDHLLYLMSFLPYFPLKLYVFVGDSSASQTATDFATELAQPFSFVCSDIIWVQDRFCIFTQITCEFLVIHNYAYF